MGIAESKSTLTTPKAYTDFERQGYNVFQKDGQNYVEIDGKPCVIKPWDTVWTVTHKKLLSDNKNNEQKTKWNKELGKLKEKFAVACDFFDSKFSFYKEAGHNYLHFLMSNHATNLIDLKGTQAYEQGMELRNIRSQASSEENRALAEVLNTNNTIQSLCSQIRHSV